MKSWIVSAFYFSTMVIIRIEINLSDFYMTKMSYEKLENGKVNPTIYSLYEVSVVLGVSISELHKL